jgi:hypothetical protein
MKFFLSIFFAVLTLSSCSSVQPLGSSSNDEVNSSNSRRVAEAGHDRPKGIKACNFKAYQKLTEQEKSLLANYLKPMNKPKAIKGMHVEFNTMFDGLFQISDPELAYNYMTKEADDLLATFLSNTHAYDRLVTIFPNSPNVPFSEMITNLYQIQGDRIIVGLDAAKFKAWTESGAQFSIRNFTTGKIESGKMSKVGGSVHEGFDHQLNTSSSNMPRLQVNWKPSNEKEWLADLDIDGYRTLNFIKHLSYENSDVRFWLKSFNKKYGKPGFGVSKNQGACDENFGDGDE